MDMIFKGQECRLKLLQWSKDTNPSRLIEQMQKRIMEIRKGVLTGEARSELLKLKVELEKLYQDQARY